MPTRRCNIFMPLMGRSASSLWESKSSPSQQTCSKLINVSLSNCFLQQGSRGPTKIQSPVFRLSFTTAKTPSSSNPLKARKNTGFTLLRKKCIHRVTVCTNKRADSLVWVEWAGWPDSTASIPLRLVCKPSPCNHRSGLRRLDLSANSTSTLPDKLVS